MEQLPVEVVTNVLEYCLLPERLNLARSSRLLLQRITGECTALWVHIDFNPFKRHHGRVSTQLNKLNARLTDDMLSRLLTRVNARNVTKSLQFWHCSSIVGTGLEPLRGSRILEHVNLHYDEGHSPMLMDEPVVMEILRTMIPFKLFQVDFSPIPYYNRESRGFSEIINILTDARNGFNRELRAAKRNEATVKGTTCSSCDNPVCHASRQVIPKASGLPPCQCSKCHECFCRTAACPVSMKDWQICGKTSCVSCGQVQECSGCGHVYCCDCLLLSTNPCKGCGGRYCQDCREFAFDCDRGCNKSLCSTCSYDDNDENDMFSCMLCDDMICPDCEELKTCIYCEDFLYCSNCYETRRCDQCSQDFVQCLDRVGNCGGCDVCSGCGKIQCLSCADMEEPLIMYCDVCYTEFCKACRDVMCCTKENCPYTSCSSCSVKYNGCYHCNHGYLSSFKRRMRSHDGGASE